MIQQVDVSDIFCSLNSLCTKLGGDEVHTTSGHLKELYDRIKHIPRGSDGCSKIWTKDEKQITFSVLQSLLRIVSKPDYIVNDLLLGGTCLVTLLCQVLESKEAALCCIDLISFFGKSCNTGNDSINDVSQSCTKRDDLSFVYTEVESICAQHFSLPSVACSQFKNTEKSSVHFSVPLLAILHGIVSCHKVDLLSCQLENHNTSTSFFIIVFDWIFKLIFSSVELYYHAFQVLLLWSKTASDIICASHIMCACTSEKPRYFYCNSDIVQKILYVLERNWECPINGVPESVRNIYKALFEANIKEMEVTNTTDQLCHTLLENTMKLSWKVKGKYIVLASLMYHVDLTKFLLAYPSAPTDMMYNVKANYIASILSEVYKTVLLKIVTEPKTAFEEWKTWWLEPILKTLLSNDESLLQNVRNYILPVTLKMLPNSYFILMKTLKAQKYRNDMAEVVLLRIAKESGIYQSKPQHLHNELLNKLHHSSDCIRIEVLTILCSSSKRSEPVDEMCLELIKQFLIMNLNIDSSAFNQSMIANFKLLLCRIRDSTTKFIKSNKDLMDWKQIEFIEWLAQTTLTNTFPGACYQRRRTCLRILDVIFSSFLLAHKSKGRKEQPGNIRTVLSFVQKKKFWLFFNDGSLLRIFPCLTDFTDDVRSLAAYLLRTFFPWEEINSLNIAIDIESLLKRALNLCCSSHIRLADSGALLCQIIFSRCIVNQGKKLVRQNFSFSVQSFNCYEAGLDFLQYLLEMAEQQLTESKKAFLKTAIDNPVHGSYSSQIDIINAAGNLSTGTLHTILRCISCDAFLTNAVCQYDVKFVGEIIQRIISISQETVDYMLSVMMGDIKTESAPSFGDIGQALQAVIARDNKETCASDEESIFCTDAGTNSSVLSPEFQLLLSYCWHSVKNSCFLATELVAPILKFKGETEKVKNFLHQISSILSSALLKCRHRGVIEACNSAMSKFCKELLSADCDFDDIPNKLLNEGLNALACAIFTSVTRRSAGIPLLIQAVVSGEQDKHKGKFLSHSIRELLKIINEPLHSYFDQRMDLPQVAAYHVLRTLVADSSLSHKILSWLDEIFPVCISGFSSEEWAVRNAAHQLFGVLLPRMCGQKKTRDDDSKHNLVSPAELFMRCPKLYSFLYERFSFSISCHERKQLCPELVPLLTLITKLSPEKDNSTNRKYITDFNPLLLPLLESPLWHVRNMTSSALSTMFCINQRQDELSILLKSAIESSHTNSNQFNGVLLTVQKTWFACENFKIESCKSLIDIITSHSDWIIATVTVCDVNSPLLLDILWKLFCVTNAVELQSIILRIKACSIDFESKRTLWSHHYLLSILQFYDLSEAVDIIFEVLFTSQAYTNACLKFFHDVLEKNVDCEADLKISAMHWKKILGFIVDSSENMIEPVILCDILSFIITLCCKHEISTLILDAELTCLLESWIRKLYHENLGLSVSAFALNIASFCIESYLLNKKDFCKSIYSLIEFWVRVFFDFCHPRKQEILKLNAAQFVSKVGSSIVNFLSVELQLKSDLTADLLLCLFDGSLVLLEDEDEVVREQASLFVSSLPHEHKVQTIQRNTGMNVLCNYISDLLSTNGTYIQHLWCKLQNFESTSKILRELKIKKRICLFEQEYVNVYAEPVILTFYDYIQLEGTLHKLHASDFMLWKEKMLMFTSDVKHDAMETNAFLNSYVDEVSDVTFIEFLSQPAVYLAIFKLNCALKVMCGQKSLLATSCELEDSLRETENCMENLQNIFSSFSSWLPLDWLFQSKFKI